MAITHLVGNLGRDAEIRKIGGKDFASFSVAETREFTDSQGQQRSETSWFRCLKLDNSGKLTTFLVKGTKVYVFGDLRVSTYKNKDGNDVTDVTIWVNKIDFLSPKQSLGHNQPAKDLYKYATQENTSQQNTQKASKTESGEIFPF